MAFLPAPTHIQANPQWLLDGEEEGQGRRKGLEKRQPDS